MRADELAEQTLTADDFAVVLGVSIVCIGLLACVVWFCAVLWDSLTDRRK